MIYQCGRCDALSTTPFLIGRLCWDCNQKKFGEWLEKPGTIEKIMTFLAVALVIAILLSPGWAVLSLLPETVKKDEFELGDFIAQAVLWAILAASAWTASKGRSDWSVAKAYLIANCVSGVAMVIHIFSDGSLGRWTDRIAGVVVVAWAGYAILTLSRTFKAETADSLPAAGDPAGAEVQAGEVHPGS